MVAMGFRVVEPEIVRAVPDGEIESVVPEMTMGAAPGVRVVADGEFGLPIMITPGLERSVITGWFPIVVIGLFPVGGFEGPPGGGWAVGNGMVSVNVVWRGGEGVFTGPWGGGRLFPGS